MTFSANDDGELGPIFRLALLCLELLARLQDLGQLLFEHGIELTLFKYSFLIHIDLFSNGDLPLIHHRETPLSFREEPCFSSRRPAGAPRAYLSARLASAN